MVSRLSGNYISVLPPPTGEEIGYRHLLWLASLILPSGFGAMPDDFGIHLEGLWREDMPNLRLARRKLICGSLAFAGTSWLLGSKGSAANTLPPTPAQTPGPFYPVSFPQDSDNDLVHVSGHSGAAKGIITRITGRILDSNGRPIPGARIEIWQCDVNGRYHYVRDGRIGRPRDGDFQG